VVSVGAVLWRAAAEDSALAAAAARPFTARLPADALGRGVEQCDRRVNRQIMREAASDDRRKVIRRSWHFQDLKTKPFEIVQTRGA
jgi:hypothetical protein